MKALVLRIQLPSRSALPGQLILFAMVGSLGTLLHYCTLIFLVQAVHINPVLSSTAGFLIGALANYLLNYRFTFCSSERHFTAIRRFYTVAVIGLFLNGAILSLLVEKLFLHYLAAQVLATSGVFIWNFFGNRYWTFNGAGCEKAGD